MYQCSVTQFNSNPPLNGDQMRYMNSNQPMNLTQAIRNPSYQQNQQNSNPNDPRQLMVHGHPYRGFKPASPLPAGKKKHK